MNDIKIWIQSAKIYGAATPMPSEEQLRAVGRIYSLRRADRFIRLAVNAAADVAGNTALPPEDTALITATAFGPQNTTFATLDDILDYPEDQILPTGFSHSVHNAAASYIGAALKLRGAVFALTGFDGIFAEALELASALLAGQRAQRVLLTALDEHSKIFDFLPNWYPERIPHPPREGVCALLLSASPDDNRLGELRRRDRGENPEKWLFPFGLDREFAEALENGTPEQTIYFNRPLRRNN